MKRLFIFLLIILVTNFVNAGLLKDNTSYPYKSNKFNILLEDSYKETTKVKASEFYLWMEDAYKNSSFHYPEKESLAFKDLLNYQKEYLINIISSTDKKAEEEMKISAWFHRLIKTIIPKFSLSRGFEFSNVVKYGERQCFLQSVLIASLLQYIGIPAGVVMVYKNIKGEETNNGHAIVIVKLADKKDIIVDASDKEPFVKHQGLFMRVSNGNYLYVNPVYEENGAKILYYKEASSGKEIDVSNIKTLDFNFIRSQFYYYRGERVTGGLFEGRKSKEGLEQASKFLKKSINFCPQNPLAVYMLGIVLKAEGKTDEGLKLIGDAYKLYVQYGWVPQGVKDSLK